MLVDTIKISHLSKKEQETLIAKTIGCSRFVFNHFWAQWNEAYKETCKGFLLN